MSRIFPYKILFFLFSFFLFFSPSLKSQPQKGTKIPKTYMLLKERLQDMLRIVQAQGMTFEDRNQAFAKEYKKAKEGVQKLQNSNQPLDSTYCFIIEYLNMSVDIDSTLRDSACILLFKADSTINYYLTSNHQPIKDKAISLKTYFNIDLKTIDTLYNMSYALNFKITKGETCKITNNFNANIIPQEIAPSEPKQEPKTNTDGLAGVIDSQSLKHRDDSIKRGV